MSASKPTLIYWPIRARNVLILLALHKGGIAYDWDKASSWQKDQTPFGQLPLLVDGDLRLGQSLAIARYIGRKAHLLGDTDTEFGISEMLVQQYDDLYNILAKAQYSQPRSEAMKVAIVNIQKSLELTQNLLKGDTFTGKLLLGDLAIFGMLDLFVKDIKPDILDSFPKLKAFYERVAADDAVKGYLALPMGGYFKTPD
eukprot:TRINITY_DN13166_c0_g1_i1.p1 TRINITY_DN13166_c0_g1~~TRINITY_DN13166_c0_g1_i1.p1  ORF type:complete len:206 (+),score=31.44 TRINITY_DN13166_c0_g1_i1:22-618(+)